VAQSKPELQQQRVVTHKGSSGPGWVSADHRSSSANKQQLFPDASDARRVSMHHHTQPDPPATESFPTDPSGPPEAGRP